MNTIRELAGWLLVLVGLFVFYICFALLLSEHAILHAIFLTVIGVMVFRGGMHLVRLSVAGRICREAQQAASQPSDRPRDPISATSLQKARIRNLGKR